VCGYIDEGRRWLEAALRLPFSGDADLLPVRARVLTGAGVLAGLQGDYVQAVAWFEEALALTRPTGDGSRISIQLAWLGWAAYGLGEYGRSRVCYEESLALAREKQPPSPGIVSFILNGLGNLLQSQGDYAAARTCYEESLALRREIGYHTGIVCSLHNLGQTLLYQGEDLLQAGELFRESLSLAWEVREKAHIAAVMAGLAAVAQKLGQAARAAQLLGQAEALRLATGFAIAPADRQAYDRCVEAVRARLGQAAFETAWAEGQARTLEAAVAFALAGS
jgi:tetratricopeptide (TPR) repeat protein